MDCNFALCYSFLPYLALYTLSNMTTSLGTIVLRRALKNCSFDRLRRLYHENRTIITLVANKKLVTESDMDKNSGRVRKKMEAHLLEALATERLNSQYTSQKLQHLKGMGGMQIAAVEGKGATSFVYTCGFTELRGKELLLQNVHRSMLDKGAEQFNYFYQRLKKGGDPLGDGHTIADAAGMSYIARAPTDEEAIFLKASKMLEATRLYGLKGYDLLLIVPVGCHSKSGVEEGIYATREETLNLAKGLDINGFKANQESAKPLEICAWCHKTTTDEGTPLSKCASCKKKYYTAVASTRNWTGKITRGSADSRTKRSSTPPWGLFKRKSLVNLQNGKMIY